MRKIPEQFVSEVLSRVDIVELIKQHVHIQRSGAQFKALCPFHQEKTPSFIINQQKQFYYCFGCGARGDAIQFLKEHVGLHFADAVEQLANLAGMEVPKEELSAVDQKQVDTQSRCYSAIEQAAGFFESTLKKCHEAKPAIDYLKSRGLSGVIAKKFRLGFAPQTKDAMISHVRKGANASLQDLQSAGLCSNDPHKGLRARFWMRIMFPIRNRRGIVVGFGARVVGKGGEPKYLNSPESIVFSKKNELYGLYEAKQANKIIDNLIVVEGYMDVIALHQVGITNAVATLGTSLTKEHIEILFANSESLVFCFDGDRAGRGAAKRAMELCLPVMRDNRRVKFLLLPDEYDPDSYVREYGVEKMLEKANRAVPISDYLFSEACVNLNFDIVDDRLTAVTNLKPSLELLPETGMLKEMLYDRLAQMVGVDRAALLEKDFDSKKFRNLNNGKVKKYSPMPKMLSPAYRTLAIILREPALLEKIDMSPYRSIKMPGITLLCEVVDILKNGKNLSFSEIRTNLPNQLAASFVENELKGLIGFLSYDGLEQELNGALTQIKNFAKEQVMDDLITQAKVGSLGESEKDKLMKLLTEKNNYSS
ncbi:MAG: DNA primase [Francisellaceae bacterium]|nr:DNA primase [Francisellaceae bacterium]MBT6207526.1 DNA primase [Francisellaceae bacterium]MBT6538385.1 DNA primase [Francisellaceae bacterium]